MSQVREKACVAAHELATLLEGREGIHGDYRRNAEIASGLKEHLTSIEDPVLREAADAIACKLARIATSGEYVEDNWVAVAGYALLALGYVREQMGSEI